MKIEAADLRLADVVRLPGEGEREITKIEINGDVRVWYRGENPDDDPPHVLEPGAVFEVQRPGDLFKPAPPPKTIAEGRERILKHMAALGWTVREAGHGNRYDYVTDPSDTVRLKIKDQAVARQERIFDDGRYNSKGARWIWDPNTRSLGQIKAFAADIERESARLLRRARELAAERFASDEQQIAAQTGAAVASEPDGPVVVRYSELQGVLLGGATKPNKDAIKALTVPYRFKFSRNLPGDAAWYVPRTRGTYQPRERVEQVATALRGRGVSVVVEYTERGSSATATATNSTKLPSSVKSAAVAQSEVEPVESPARAGRPPDNAKRAAKLRELADKMEAAAAAALSVRRQDNTLRRASIAARMVKRAHRQDVLAKTIRRSADAVERGELEYIGRVGSAAEIEALDSALGTAMYWRDQKLNRRESERDPESEDVEFAEYSRAWARRNELTDLIDATQNYPQYSEQRRRVEQLARPSDSDGGIDLVGADLESVRTLLAAVRRDKDRKPPHSSQALHERLTGHERLLRLGIHDTATLRAALREYLGCCRGKVELKREDPLVVKKRELQFANIRGYFPTPRALAERLVEAADIRPGHRVLEPSAGSGSIAEVIRERHPDAQLDVIEFNHTLHDLLEAQGFNVIGYDFNAFEEYGAYDRVIMNPPFEAGQDAQHIHHAFDRLAPGGRLVAVASAGFSSRDDAKTVRVREHIERLGGRIEPLPTGSFAESGTNVNTVMVVVDMVRPAVSPPPPEPKPKPKPKPAEFPVSELMQRWQAHVASGNNMGASVWRNLPKTSCWVRSEGDASVTLCTAIQKHAIGDCPPSMAGAKSKAKQLMLCQVDEDVEYFRGQTPGILEAKAEADNRMVRGRVRALREVKPLPRPAADDFAGLEQYLDALVPSRIVYKPSEPLTPLEVKLAPPSELDGTIEIMVIVDDRRVRLDEFEAQLGDALIPYRGLVGAPTLSAVVAKVWGEERRKLVDAGVTLHDVQYGRFGGRTIYWLRSPDGTILAGPVTADGELARTAEIRRAFAAVQDGTLPLTSLPEGWTLDDTIVWASMIKGRRVWAAWQPKTELFTTKGDGDDWLPPKPLVKRATWDRKTGFADFVHMLYTSVTNNLQSLPHQVRTRVAGPWLGAVFPSDYPAGRVVFDPPTGGVLDPDELTGAYAEVMELLAENPDDTWLPKWVELERKRIAWAKGWTRKQAAAARKAARAEKDKDMAAKKAKSKKDAGKGAKPKREGKPNKSSRKVDAKAKGKAANDKPAAKGKAVANDKPAAKGKAAANGNSRAGEKAATNGKAHVNGKAPAIKAPVTNGKAPATNGKTHVNGKAQADGKPVTAIESKPGAKGSKRKPSSSKPKTAKPTPTSAKPKPTTAKPAAASTDATPKKRTRGPLRFRRNDVVRFRKRSHVAKGLGVDEQRTFTVELMTRHDGRPVVLLRFGTGKHAGYMKVPPGHLALVRSADALPDDLRACAAKLSRLDGPITAGTRRLMAELARRS